MSPPLRITASVFSAWPDAMSSLLHGLAVSLEVTGATLVVGYPLGLLLAVMVRSRHRAVRWPVLALVEVGRGVPALVALELIYFGLPQAGLTVGAFVATVLGLGWSAGAYSSEVFRGSLEAVHTGQTEAAAAVGLSSRDAFRFVVLPQAMRVALPPLVSMAIQVFQLSSLAFVITLQELMSAAYDYGTITFAYLSVLLLAGCFYAAISLPGSALAGLLERRLSRHLDTARH
jgi:polar amino acid transport system permease protein